ncbi:MAG TPA: hypothetical protein VF828_02045 [Patescibacteria group bacterium]
MPERKNVYCQLADKRVDVEDGICQKPCQGKEGMPVAARGVVTECDGREKSQKGRLIYYQSSGLDEDTGERFLAGLKLRKVVEMILVKM